MSSVTDRGWSGSGATERLRAGFVVVGSGGGRGACSLPSGLFLRALWRVQDVNPGFTDEGVLTARTALPMPKYEVTAAREQFYARILADVRALPGVTSAAYTSFLPMVMRGGIWPVLTATSAAPQEAPHGLGALCHARLLRDLAHPAAARPRRGAL